MVTAASAYFLTCCRPVFNSSFCYYIETPKLINLYYYPLFQSRRSECNHHKQLRDHCLNPFTTCTDGRAWSLDKEQQRHHFLDTICGRIPLCGNEDQSPPCDKDVYDQRPKQPEEVVVRNEVEAELEKEKDKSILEGLTDIDIKPSFPAPIKECLEVQEKAEKPFECLPTPPPSPVLSFDQKSSKDESSPKEDEKSLKDESSLKEDIVLVTDELINKLNHNLANLESTFDKFVKKNRDFIQSLVGCLNFEKQKQKALEQSYNKLKQENDILKTKNEYLKLVNMKQQELFRDELDKGLSENKAVYKNKIEHLEVQLQSDQDKLLYYKQSERKYLEFAQNENMEVAKLKNEVKSLKSKETKLLKNYVIILNFLEDVKETLNNTTFANQGLPMRRSSNTISDSGIHPTLKEVLKIALTNGMTSLNVRDLSILHDAIQELNERLCHQNEFCGKNPLSDISVSHLSMIYTEFEEYPVTDVLPKGIQDYETPSNLSMYPSRQKANNDQANR